MVSLYEVVEQLNGIQKNAIQKKRQGTELSEPQKAHPTSKFILAL